MSFNRLNYDWNAYQHELRQSVGTGMYVLGRPAVHEKPCFPLDADRKPSAQLPSSTCGDRELVDVSSELLGITRRASNDPNQDYFPGDGACMKNQSLRDCGNIHSEDTRLSNPPATLKSTGWNRWEWLCRDPQHQAFVPFDYNISNRLVVKDNHRPYLQRPIDQSAALPPANASDDVVTWRSGQFGGSREPVDQPPSSTWKSCDYYTKEYGVEQ